MAWGLWKKVAVISATMLVVIVFSLSRLFAESKKPSGEITGSFVQPWLAAYWSSGQWKRQIHSLLEDGVDDHIIWQWTVDSQLKTAYYPTTLLGYRLADGLGLEDPVRKSLKYAKSHGLKIWLGLSWSKEWWKKYANDQVWLEKEFALSVQIADDLWRLYGNDFGGTIAGFYLPMEMDNYNFPTFESQNRMAYFYKRICEHIHSKMNKQVMVSPFCADAGFMNQDKWQKMWEYILNAAAIDVINLQDGCGASEDGKRTHTTVATVASWFAATKNAIQKARPSVQLWSNLETFDMEGHEKIYTTKNPARIHQQIRAVKPYVSRISSFAVIHYRVGSTVPAAAQQAGQVSNAAKVEDKTQGK